MKNRLCSIVKNESGSSILYVLAIMLMLVIIGTSVLTAAVANVGFSTRQSDHTKGVMLSDAIHRNLMYSIQTPPSENTSGGAGEEYLSTKIPDALIALNAENMLAEEWHSNQVYLQPFHMELDFPDTDVEYESKNVRLEDGDGNQSITVKFTKQQITYHAAVPGVGALPYEPAVANLVIDMEVSVTVYINNSPMVNVAYYQFNGTYQDDESAPFSMGNLDGMVLKDGWEWRLIRYEKAQS